MVLHVLLYNKRNTGSASIPINLFVIKEYRDFSSSGSVFEAPETYKLQ